ncbi:MAG: glycosyl transferase, partial [Gluconacetobacter diazotrophicus]|nr:glycosyl transferase [Gluconacetobacter diazotrophicus]
MSDAVRIFVGCDPNDCDLEQMLVLDASLRRRTSLPLDITFMRLSRDPGSPWFSDPDAGHGWNTARWPTPFSGLRWGIPAACGGKGRALYLDADILCLADIAALWRMEIPPGRAMLAAGEGRRLRLGTMLLDNAAMARHLPPIEALRRDPRAHEAAKALFEKRGDLVGPLP